MTPFTTGAWMWSSDCRVTASTESWRRCASAPDKIRFVQVRHEEAAAFMACAYAKYTGKLGVCLATSGPGGIHLLNGLYDAKLDGQPVLAHHRAAVSRSDRHAHAAGCRTRQGFHGRRGLQSRGSWAPAMWRTWRIWRAARRWHIAACRTSPSPSISRKRRSIEDNCRSATCRTTRPTCARMRVRVPPDGDLRTRRRAC